MKILTLDGGGTAAYVQICLLERLETLYGMPCGQLFDMVAGVSAGSIVGAAVANGIPMRDFKKTFSTLAERIFQRPASWYLTPWKPFYRIDDLHVYLNNAFDGKLISACQRPFMCCATPMSLGSGYSRFWRSWDPADKGIKLSCAVTTSCAAPIYFGTHEVDGQHYCDGGLATSNMSVCAIVEALSQGKTLEDMRILNLQANGTPFDNEAAVTIFDWLRNLRLINMALTGATELAQYQAEVLLKDRYVAVTPARFLGIDSLDFAGMEQIANEAWVARGHALFQFLP